MNKKAILLAFASALLLATLSFVVIEQVVAQIPIVDVLPSEVEVHVGDSFSININVSDVEDLYGFEFKLDYNTIVLDTLNVTVPPPWPTPLVEIVDSEGYIRVNSSLTAPPGITANLTLASITFKATGLGDTILDLHITNFLNSTGGPIPRIVRDGFVSVPPLRVPTDYSTIQEAINAASPGDTIFVYGGIYPEHVVVNKTVNLLGENKDFTVIDGNETGDVVQVAATDVHIEGFTIQRAGYASGVYVGGPFTFTMTGNNIKNNHWGINLAGYGGNTIVRNNIANSDVGVFLNGSSNNKIISNAILNNNFGIISSNGATNNTIDNNNISNNNQSIYIVSSYNHTIIGNNVFNNVVYGIFLNSSTGNIIYHNNFINNTNQVSLVDSIVNTWDNGCEGNYWSDYTGEDSNQSMCSLGIGDTLLPHQDVDHYPLMSPYIPADANHDGVVDSTDDGMFGAAWGSTVGWPNYNPHVDFNMDNAIDSTDDGILGLYWGRIWS